MKDMKVFVIGASGFIGNMLLNYFSREYDIHNIQGSFYSHHCNGLVYLDMTDKYLVNKVIESFKPNVIIHPAANPNVEYCEEHPKETWHINVYGSKNIIESAKNIRSKLVFFSSDYIFDGTNGPYSEDDVPNPISEYGRQKLAIERLIKSFLEDYLIIRTTVVYGWERNGKNFVTQVIKNLANGKPMKIPYDQIGSPTYANNMIQAVKRLIELDKSGIYNISGSDLMDRYTFATRISEIFDLDKNMLIPVTTKELGQKAKRPLNAGMKIEKLQKDMSIHMMSVKEGLEHMKEHMKKI